MRSEQIAALTKEEREDIKMRQSLKGRTQTEIVALWYKSETPFTLTESEERMRKRWDWAKAQFLAVNTYAETVESLMAEFGISVSQARIDIRNMRNAFGDLDEVPKHLHRQRAIEMALKAFKKAEKEGDIDGMTKATKVYISAAGLDRDDTEVFDLDKMMKERMYVEVMDPQLRTLLLNLLDQSGGVLDTSAMFERARAAKDSSEYIDHEEIPAT